MPDVFLHLHQFVFGFKSIERFSGVVAEVEFLEDFGLLRLVLLSLDDLL